MIEGNKAMPHAEGVEKSILSSMLQNPETHIQKAKAEGLKSSMFYSPARSLLFSLFVAKNDSGKELELVGFGEELRDSGKLDAIGGPSALSEIYTYAPTAAHWDSHVEMIRDRFARREAILSAVKISDAAYSGDSSETLKVISEGLESVKLATAQKKSFQNARETHQRFLDVMTARVDAGEMPGLSTGITQLDEIGGGMRDGEFWVICGETSAGKSALSYQLTLPALEQNLNVLVFTLEMGSEEVFSRLISCRNRIDLGSIMTPRGISKGEGQSIQKASSSLAESGLQICDEPNMSIDYICSQSEQFADGNEISLIIVDYIQLIEGARNRGESREQELAQTSRRLKQLAKKLKCPVISPAQLNDDGKLRESRAIGQDADVVLKITDKGIAVNKFRNAQRNSLLRLALVGKHQRFETIH